MLFKKGKEKVPLGDVTIFLVNFLRKADYEYGTRIPRSLELNKMVSPSLAGSL